MISISSINPRLFKKVNPTFNLNQLHKFNHKLAYLSWLSYKTKFFKVN